MRALVPARAPLVTSLGGIGALGAWDPRAYFPMTMGVRLKVSCFNIKSLGFIVKI